jgi:type VI protein secretion system component VasK
MTSPDEQINPIEKFGYLLTYRRWFFTSFLLLTALASVAIAFIIVEIVTSSLVFYTGIAIKALVVIGGIMILLSLWGASTELRISRQRKLIHLSEDDKEFLDDFVRRQEEARIRAKVALKNQRRP